jgi:hypothetical protein
MNVSRSVKRGKCRDCRRGTFLEWTVPCLSPDGRVIHALASHNRGIRVCQSCARRRGGEYALALRRFVTPRNGQPFGSDPFKAIFMATTIEPEGVEVGGSGVNPAVASYTDDPKAWLGEVSNYGDDLEARPLGLGDGLLSSLGRPQP